MDDTGYNENSKIFQKDRDLREKTIPFKKSFLFKRASSEKRFYLVLSDILSMVISVVLGLLLTKHIQSSYLGLEQIPWPDALQTFYLMFGLPMMMVIAVSEYYGNYSRFKPFWDEYGQFLKIVFSIVGMTTIYLFLIRSQFSRLWLTSSWIVVFFVVPIARVATKRWLMRRGKWFTPTVVLGAGENALESARAIESNILMGFKVVALIEIDRENTDVEHRIIKDFLSEEDHVYPVFHIDENGIDKIKQLGSPYIVLALDSNDYTEYKSLLDLLASNRHNMSIIPPLRGLPLLGSEISPIFRHEVLHIRIKNNLAKRFPRAVKRIFDIVVSSILIVVLAPLFFFLAWGVRKDGGEVLFIQQRVGENGKMFGCLKFRSMYMDAEARLQEILMQDEHLKNEWENNQKLDDDPRITSIGRIMRKTSLDEIPQLFNVFIGEMSLVGPRPIRQDELSRYGTSASNYLETRPGLTGLWQISGRNSVSYQTRVYLDTWYVRNWSLWYDITILMKTIGVVYKGSGAK